MSKIKKRLKLRQSTNWESLSNEDLEKEYNPSSIIGGNYQPYIEQYIARSESAKNQLDITECQSVSYTHLTLPTILLCRSRWSPYH